MAFDCAEDGYRCMVLCVHCGRGMEAQGVASTRAANKYAVECAQQLLRGLSIGGIMLGSTCFSHIPDHTAYMTNQTYLRYLVDFLDSMHRRYMTDEVIAQRAQEQGGGQSVIDHDEAGSVVVVDAACPSHATLVTMYGTVEHNHAELLNQAANVMQR